MNGRRSILLVFIITLSALCVGTLLGELWHGSRMFPFPQLSAIKQSLLAKRPPPKTSRSMQKQNNWCLQIPIRYLPHYRIENDEQGTKLLVREDGNALLKVPAEEVALVLVDTWGKPQESANPSPIRSNQKSILELCRSHNVTIIHAPNRPVVEKYPQYHRIRDNVNDFLKEYDVGNVNHPPFLDWPSPSNDIWQKAKMIRASGKKPKYQVRPTSDRDISRHLTPLEDEYVLSSYMEFRYVLWRERINLLLYIGGALNECMQHRDTGINLLAGSDSRLVPITIVVLEDCSSAMASPSVDAKTAAEAMLEYFRFKIAFTADSKNLQFVTHQ